MISFVSTAVLLLLRPFLLIWFFVWIHTGNQQFSQSLEAAHFYYDKVLRFSSLPESVLAYYNKGNAFYTQKNYQDAEKSFSDALLKANKKQQALIYYNLGNTQYRLGEEKLSTNPQETIALWESAIKQYEEALAFNPDDTDAQENIDFIKKKLAELKNKSSSTQASPDQPQDQSYEDAKKRIQESENAEKENYKQYKKFYRDQQGNTQDKSQPYW